MPRNSWNQVVSSQRALREANDPLLKLAFLDEVCHIAIDLDLLEVQIWLNESFRSLRCVELLTRPVKPPTTVV
jgi:hypothetical protein